MMERTADPLDQRLLTSPTVRLAPGLDRHQPPPATDQGLRCRGYVRLVVLSDERAAERARLLRVCPAHAPSWNEEQESVPGLEGELVVRRRLGLSDDSTHVARLHEEPGAVGDGSPWEHLGILLSVDEQRMLSARLSALDASVEALQEYLWSLPPERTGTLWIDEPLGEAVVQVTEGADRAATEAAVERLVREPATVRIEVVRYSAQELEAIAEKISELPGLEWSGIGCGADGCVEVTVPSDVEAAERLIAAVADPCSYRVIEGTWSF